MTKDYAKRPRRTATRNSRHQPTRKQLPGWLWMIGGILVGTLVMSVVNHGGSPRPVSVAEESPLPEINDDTPKPRFDFYTLLKESEVIVPDEPIAPATPVEVPLPSVEPDSDTATAVAARDTPQPATSQPVPDTAARSAEPAPLPADTKPATEPEKVVTSAPQPVPPSEVYLLQAGSFKSATDADTLRAKLLMLNMQARVETVNLKPGETWHRVQVGPFSNTQSLADARNTLQQNGIASIQVQKKR